MQEIAAALGKLHQLLPPDCCFIEVKIIFGDDSCLSLEAARVRKTTIED